VNAGLSIAKRVRGSRVYFDTNVIIYFIEQNPEYFAAVAEIFKLIGTDEISAVTSEFTLAEVLIKPIREQQFTLVQSIKGLLLDQDFFTLTPCPRPLFLRAAEIAAPNGLRTADAIHMASAIESNCHHFITNDARFRSMHGVSVICLRHAVSAA